jgi:hypothetical protein
VNPGTERAPMGWTAAVAWLTLIAGGLTAALVGDWRPAAVAAAVFLALAVLHGMRLGHRR